MKIKYFLWLSDIDRNTISCNIFCPRTGVQKGVAWCRCDGIPGLMVGEVLCCTWQDVVAPPDGHWSRTRWGQVPGARWPQSANTRTQEHVNLDIEYLHLFLSWKSTFDRFFSYKLNMNGCKLLLVLFCTATCIQAEDTVPETIYLPYSETEDVDFTISLPSNVGCYQW